MAQAVMRALAINAAKGQQRAQRLFAELLDGAERELRRERQETVEVLFDYKRSWERELARRAALGIVAPDPVPHPDHIRVDLWTGSYEISGPLTREDAADLEIWRKCRRALVAGDESLASLLAEGAASWSPEERAEMEAQRRANAETIALVDRMLRSGRPLPVSLLEGFDLDDAGQTEAAVPTETAGP
jgi:hypothetical protein